MILVYVFSLGPILITAAVSFNPGNRSYFPPRGFSLRWWERAFAPEWLDPLWFSLKLGSLTALISTAARAAARLRAATATGSADARRSSR